MPYPNGCEAPSSRTLRGYLNGAEEEKGSQSSERGAVLQYSAKGLQGHDG